MTTAQTLVQAAFSPYEVPAPFQTIEEFSLITDDGAWPFGDCNLSPPNDDILNYWAGSAASASKMAEQLKVWLHGPDGYLYAFWSYDGRPMLEAPIVYLDDEGDGSAVVANNLDEFLSIAAHGFNRIKHDELEPWPDELPSSPEAFFTARHITPAQDWAQRMSAARDAHPDFEAWLDELLS